VLQRRVLNELSKSILSGEVKKDSVVLMELNPEGEIAFTNLDAEIDRAAGHM
jgi:ATP-dependent Clp protease ATP-binding subunit ClpB